jgi:hypothetical protein
VIRSERQRATKQREERLRSFLLRAAERDSRRLQDVPSLRQLAGRFCRRFDESSQGLSSPRRTFA